MTQEWKRTYTTMSVDVDVDLSEFRVEQLLQELINREFLAPGDAADILAKKRRKDAADTREAAVRRAGDFHDLDQLFMAGEELACGRRVEALVHLERALGRQWSGVLVQ